MLLRHGTKGGGELKEHLSELESETGIRILHKSRDGRMKKTGGGVAIAFDTATCNLKVRTLKHVGKDQEVLCAVGVVGKVARGVAVFAIYVQPSLRAADLESLKESVCVEIGALRKTHKNPIILVTGDFNHRDFNSALNEVGEFTSLITEPTRGGNTFDLIFTNTPVAHSETLVLPPLQTDTGALSDHKCVFTEASFPPDRGYQWVTQMRRTRDESRERAFAAELAGWDWGSLAASESVDVMARNLEGVIGTLMDKNFPLARVRKRSNESPWITRRIRRLWKKKIRLYKKKGKSQAWWETERKLQKSIDEARSGFVDRLLEEGSAGKSFYAATKKLASPAAAPQWSVSDLFPGQGPQSVCDEVLRFYGSISTAPAEQIPVLPTSVGNLGEFTASAVAELLGNVKKTNSRVDGIPCPILCGGSLMPFPFPSLPSSTGSMLRAGGLLDGKPST